MTHTFEIIINGNSIEGQMEFVKGAGTKITIAQPIAISGRMLGRIKELLDFHSGITQDYGEIDKIEVRRIGFVEEV
jgi:hypothetical protein